MCQSALLRLDYCFQSPLPAARSCVWGTVSGLDSFSITACFLDLQVPEDCILSQDWCPHHSMKSQSQVVDLSLCQSSFLRPHSALQPLQLPFWVAVPVLGVSPFQTHNYVHSSQFWPPPRPSPSVTQISWYHSLILSVSAELLVFASFANFVCITSQSTAESSKESWA